MLGIHGQEWQTKDTKSKQTLAQLRSYIIFPLFDLSTAEGWVYICFVQSLFFNKAISRSLFSLFQPELERERLRGSQKPAE